MKTFWNDVYDNHDVWSALSISVSEVVNPSVQLKSGNDLKFKLDAQGQTLFWGRIDHGFYGAWFLRNKTELPTEQSMIRSINSSDIESMSFDDTFDKHKAWSRFFAEGLSNSSYSMLFEGKWLISSANIKSSSYHRDKVWQIMKPENAFSHGNPFWIDWNWGGAVGDLLPLKEEPHQDSGRVKWFRKLVKTGKCPPILCWYLNALDAFVILDGHCRLKAFIEEKVSPEILVLSAIQEQKIELDKVKQKHIYEAVIKSKEMSVEHANKLLIESFDNRPLISRISRSKAVRGLSAQWDNEIARFKDSADIDFDQLEAMSYIIEENKN